MVERRAPTTDKVVDLILTHKNDPNAHHVPGGADVKSGTIVASIGSNSVTFTTAFSSIPQVVLTAQDATLALRDCLYVVRSVSTTGFTFDADAAATYAWVATDAGNP